MENKKDLYDILGELQDLKSALRGIAKMAYDENTSVGILIEWAVEKAGTAANDLDFYCIRMRREKGEE